MIELCSDKLTFSFPEVHPRAQLVVEFKRTLRVPDDGQLYPLPAELGTFPLRHVDDYAKAVPAPWVKHSGIFLPMYQSEALWMRFTSGYVPEHSEEYLFAIKVATGKIDAISGCTWGAGIIGSPQNYIIVPRQPWLDGFCNETGCVRQFVAAPLGSGYTVEEQISGEAQYGGIQLEVYPMRRKSFEKFCLSRLEQTQRASKCEVLSCCGSREMAICLGGRIQQQVYADEYGVDQWDMGHVSRVFVHIANSLEWRSITRTSPPARPFTPKEYAKACVPWFDSYDDKEFTLKGAPSLAKVKSVQEMNMAKKGISLPGNRSLIVKNLVRGFRGLLVPPRQKQDTKDDR